MYGGYLVSVVLLVVLMTISGGAFTLQKENAAFHPNNADHLTTRDGDYDDRSRTRDPTRDPNRDTNHEFSKGDRNDVLCNDTQRTTAELHRQVLSSVFALRAVFGRHVKRDVDRMFLNILSEILDDGMPCIKSKLPSQAKLLNKELRRNDNTPNEPTETVLALDTGDLASQIEGVMIQQSLSGLSNRLYKPSVNSSENTPHKLSRMYGYHRNLLPPPSPDELFRYKRSKIQDKLLKNSKIEHVGKLTATRQRNRRGETSRLSDKSLMKHSLKEQSRWLRAHKKKHDHFSERLSNRKHPVHQNSTEKQRPYSQDFESDHLLLRSFKGGRDSFLPISTQKPQNRNKSPKYKNSLLQKLLDNKRLSSEHTPSSSYHNKSKLNTKRLDQTRNLASKHFPVGETLNIHQRQDLLHEQFPIPTESSSTYFPEDQTDELLPKTATTDTSLFLDISPTKYQHYPPAMETFTNISVTTEYPSNSTTMTDGRSHLMTPTHLLVFVGVVSLAVIITIAVVCWKQVKNRADIVPEKPSQKSLLQERGPSPLALPAEEK